MTTVTRPLPAHGTPARYQGTPRTGNRAPCGCRKCVAAWTKACAAREVQRLAGVPLRIPSGPVTAHVNALLGAGMSRAQVAAAAGVSPGVVSHLARAFNPKVNRTIALKVLAVKRPRITGDADRVPIHGTRRRIRALYTLGHGPTAISRDAGHSKALIIAIAGGKQSATAAATYRAVRATYNTLAQQVGGSTRARERAQREGWRTPDYWEDMGRLDDATFDPDAADRPLSHRELAALRREEITHLAQYGFKPEEIHDRISINDEVSLSHVKNIVREVLTGKRRDRSKPTGVAA